LIGAMESVGGDFSTNCRSEQIAQKNTRTY